MDRGFLQGPAFSKSVGCLFIPMQPPDPNVRGSSIHRVLLSVLTLRRSRALLRGGWGRTLAVGGAVVYALVAMFAGQMLQLVPTRHPWSLGVDLGAHAAAWWDFPALILVAPGGDVVLPFFTTLSMTLVAFGIGLGMAVGLRLAGRFLRDRRPEHLEVVAPSAFVGLTPAMVGLLTLGACCSTAAAATAGVLANAPTAGISNALLLGDAWYLGVLQLCVVGAALLAQELLLSAYRLPGAPVIDSTAA